MLKTTHREALHNCLEMKEQRDQNPCTKLERKKQELFSSKTIMAASTAALQPDSPLTATEVKVTHSSGTEDYTSQHHQSGTGSSQDLRDIISSKKNQV